MVRFYGGNSNGKIFAHVIYRTDYATCFLDVDPINEGHILIVPKVHFVELDELDPVTANDIMQISILMSRVIKRVYHPDGITILQNGGYFNDVGHYHLHIFPRYKGDGFVCVYPNSVDASFEAQSKRVETIKNELDIEKIIDEEIKLVKFDPAWPQLYNEESQRIINKLGDQTIKIEHIGSTAISGICAKPIIDIMIGIENINKSEQITNKLIELGYEYFGEAGVPDRLYFRLRGKHNFNIALCEYKGKLWKNNLLFRDYLRRHSKLAKKYSLIKTKALKSGLNTLIIYSNSKNSFVEEVINKAKEEKSSSD